MGIINKKYFSWIIVAIFIVLVFFLVRNIFFVKTEEKGVLASTGRQELQVNKINYVKIAGKTIKVDLALTPEEQTQGLSGRKNLAGDTGMLFIFSTEGGSASGGQNNDRHYFWMKNMFFPIDIVWLDENFNVIYIKKNATPESYPDVFGPNQKSKYVLEVLANFVEKNNLKIGDKAEFLP